MVHLPRILRIKRENILVLKRGNWGVLRETAGGGGVAQQVVGKTFARELRAGARSVERELALVQQEVIGEGPQIDELPAEGELMGTMRPGDVVPKIERVVRLDTRRRRGETLEAAIHVEARHIVREKFTDIRAELVDVDRCRIPAGCCEQIVETNRGVLQRQVLAAISRGAETVHHVRRDQVGIAKSEVLNAVGLAINCRDQKSAGGWRQTRVAGRLIPIGDEVAAENRVLVALSPVDASQSLILGEAGRRLEVERSADV